MNDLFDAGKLTLRLICRDRAVAAADIGSTRAQAARVLQGKTPEQVATLVPLLFSVCGRAQGAAAQAALQAAVTGVAVDTTVRERAIASEALQEHVWRLLLDWPKLLGLPPQEQQFAAWHALLRKVSSGTGEMVGFLREFERDALGMKAEQWRAMECYADMQAWLDRGATPLARMLARLAQLKPGADTTEVALLPAWSAEEAQQACAGRWNAMFSAQPEWRGAPAETGAWSYYANVPLLQDVLQQTGSRALARVLARLMDVVMLAAGSATRRLDAANVAPGEGIASVRTARGLLLHQVQLAEGNVASYTICAPTEWNFHPAGAFARGMRGARATDEGELRRGAQIEALSLDPCVAYEVVTQDA